MIIDLRTYTYLPSKFRKFLQGYQEVGFALTSKHLGKTLGVFRSESGVQNRTFQFFIYEDHDHRDRCRAGMLADPAWGQFVKMDSDALVQQANMLLRPTDYSPVGGGSGREPRLSVDGKLRLFELTTWRVKPGLKAGALTLMAAQGAALLDRHSPDVIAYLTPETGPDHQILRLAAYASGADRQSALMAMQADPEFVEFDRRLRGLTQEVDATLLLPVPYSPLR